MGWKMSVENQGGGKIDDRPGRRQDDARHCALRQITASKRESFESDEVSKSTEIDVKEANSTLVPTYEILVQQKRFGDSLLSLDSSFAEH